MIIKNILKTVRVYFDPSFFGSPFISNYDIKTPKKINTFISKRRLFFRI